MSKRTGGSTPSEKPAKTRKTTMDQQNSDSGQSQPSGSQQPTTSQQPQPSGGQQLPFGLTDINDHEWLANYHVYKNGLLGEGQYGKVAKARDLRFKGTDVAFKICKINEPYELDAFERELKILQKIKGYKGVNNYTVSLLDHHHNEQKPLLSCLILPLMSSSLDNELERRRKVGGYFPLDEIRTLGIQIARGLEFLERLNIIHADFKPANLMFTNDRCEHLRIIDFGHAFEKDTDIDYLIQSADYRAMEVFLDLGSYTNAIDIWSFGVILVNMHSDRSLFTARTNENIDRQIVHQIVRMFGMPPDKMLGDFPTCNLYFEKDANDKWQKKPMSPEDVENEEPRRRNLKTWLGLDGEGESKDYLELIMKIMDYDVDKRIKLDDIIRHKFFEDPPAPQQ